jgi:flagellar assembly factor FliW
MILPISADDPSPSGLTVVTSRFGAAEQVVVPPSALFTFPEALPGLPDSRRFVLIGDEASAPLFWLQSLEEGAVCLPLVDVRGLQVEGYAASVHQAIGAEHETSYVFVVARFDPGTDGFLVNLLAPVVLDQRDCLGRQIILEGQDFPLRRAVTWDASARMFIASC